LANKLAGVDEVALGLDGVVLDVRGDDAVGQFGVVDAVVTAFDVAGEVFADEAIEQRAEHVLLEVPAIDGATDIVGDLPDAGVAVRRVVVCCVMWHDGHCLGGECAGTGLLPVPVSVDADGNVFVAPAT
jgi:hypothetical protein